MIADFALVFYGYSGAGLTRELAVDADLKSADSAADRDRSFFLAASTLATMIQISFPKYQVRLAPVWNHEALLDELARVDGRIQQVHVAAHGGSSGISLAYKFPSHYERLQTQAGVYFRELPSWGPRLAVGRALAREDGLIAGRLSRYGLENEPRVLEPGMHKAGARLTAAQRLSAISAKFAEEAYWHIWGCFAGNPFADYNVSPRAPELVKMYRRSLNNSLPGERGIAREIAKGFKIQCTAAVGDPGSAEGAGLLFFHRGPKGEIEASAGKKAPAWMWTKSGTIWKTYGKDSEAIETVTMFQKPRTQKELAPARVSGNDPRNWQVTTPPPEWLTRAFDKATLR